MFEIKVTLTVDPKLGALLDKVCNTFSFDNSLPFTAEQAAPVKPAASTSVKPAPSVPVTVPVQTAATAVSPTVPVTPTATNAAPAPAMTPPPATANTVPPQSTVPTAAPSYQIADLARAAATLMDAGKQPQLLDLLKQFNVQTLGQLKPEQFGQFATALRKMGAKL